MSEDLPSSTGGDFGIAAVDEYSDMPGVGIEFDSDCSAWFGAPYCAVYETADDSDYLCLTCAYL